MDYSRKLYRAADVVEKSIDADARTVELSFSSEYPVERYFGTEILDHSSASVRLNRLNDGAPLLVDHSTRDQVGVVERAWLADGKARAVVRFSRSQRAEEVFRDVVDRIRRSVSVGYQIFKAVLESREGDAETYRVVDWEPFEISLVPVPADPMVGVARSKPDFQVTGTLSALPERIITMSHVNVSEERQRAARILELGQLWSQSELAAEHIEKGTSLDQFRGILLDKLPAQTPTNFATGEDVGLSRREIERYSFCRALLACTEPATARQVAPFEFEVSQAAQNARARNNPMIKIGDRDFSRDGAITVPPDVLASPVTRDAGVANAARRMLQAKYGQRDLLVGTATAGGHTVATDLLGASFIELLVAEMQTVAMGATLMRDLRGNVAIPRQTAGAAVTWVGENANTTESQATFDQVTMGPKTVGLFTDYSRRLLIQSSIDIEAFVRMDLARSAALEIDRVAIAGSGTSNQPLGIINTAGIGSVPGGTNGAAPTWDILVDLESAVANANAATANLGYLTNTKARGKLKRTQMFSGTNGIPLWDRDGSLNGYRAGVSNNVPSNLVKGTSGAVCSAIIFGNWSELLIGMWGGLDLIVDPYTGAIAGTRRVVVLQDVDVALRHAVSFAAMLDALTV